MIAMTVPSASCCVIKASSLDVLIILCRIDGVFHASELNKVHEKIIGV